MKIVFTITVHCGEPEHVDTSSLREQLATMQEMARTLAIRELDPRERAGDPSLVKSVAGTVHVEIQE
jgi:hypothetical protein